MAQAAEPQVGEIERVARQDGRYSPEAYVFLLESLDYHLRRLPRRRHVSGQELCLAARDLARERFGMMGRHVLNSWGVFRTEDLGEIVYSLIRAKKLRQAAHDSPADFAGVFDFAEAFEKDLPISLPAE